MLVERKAENPVSKPETGFRIREETRRRSQKPGFAPGWVEVHPQAADWLREHGLSTANDFLELPGEVISGHVTRHVMQVRLGERTYYLKREHRVRLRDRWSSWWNGFGRASKSEREGRILWELQREDLSAPRCVAFGEDGRGRAFVLIEEAAGAIELLRILALRPELADDLAELLGRAIAHVHVAGFDHPDLCTKHILVHPESRAITLLDWQRSRRVSCLSWTKRIRSLAILHATLPDELASPVARLRFLWAYVHVAFTRSNPLRFRELVRRVLSQAEQKVSRHGVGNDPQAPVPVQRLVWLDGEALCAIPRIAPELKHKSIHSRLYDTTNQSALIHLTGERRARLAVRKDRFRITRLACALRGRAWRSPELRQARLLFHLERHGIPAPTLLAFGQRERSWFGRIESFLLTDAATQTVPLRLWWNACCTGTSLASRTHRRRTIDGLADLLRQLHDCGCTIDKLCPSGAPFAARRDDCRWQIVLGEVNRIRYRRRVDLRQELNDLRQLWRSWRDSVDKADVLRFLARYARGKGAAAARRLLDEV